MAKKSLKKRIDDLVHALGGAQKPTFLEIRNELFSIGPLVEALEDGQALAEKEATIAALEAENENLKVELQTANAELETFRAERKKQQEEERKKDIPDIQSEILERLPSEHGGAGLTMLELWREAGGRLDEMEIHVAKLKKAELIEWHIQDGEKLWRRTMTGNELVVAKRLAGETEEKKAYKHADLPPLEHDILAMLTKVEGGVFEDEIMRRINKTIAFTRFTLRALEKRNLATDGEEPDYGTGRRWYLLEKGEAYLAERNLL